MKKTLLLLTFVIGCSNPNDEQPTDVPLPTEAKDRHAYQNIKDIRRFNDRIEAIYVTEDKTLVYLSAYHKSASLFKIVVDADVPWWEETYFRNYHWQRHGKRWLQTRSTRCEVTVHIAKLEDIRDCR